MRARGGGMELHHILAAKLTGRIQPMDLVFDICALVQAVDVVVALWD